MPVNIRFPRENNLRKLLTLNYTNTHYAIHAVKNALKTHLKIFTLEIYSDKRGLFYAVTTARVLPVALLLLPLTGTMGSFRTSPHLVLSSM